MSQNPISIWSPLTDGEWKWNKAAFAAGQIARRNLFRMGTCPHEPQSWIYESWIAGWRDEDSSITDQENEYGRGPLHLDSGSEINP